MAGRLRPIDLARAAGLSAQQIRRYERWGFLPPAARSPSGYRQYGPIHLAALRAARAMMEGYGWMNALHIMRAYHKGDLTRALTLIDERHAALHQERRHLEETLTALRTAAEAVPAPPEEGGRPPGRRTRLYVGEAARRAGVEVSAVRFWEEQGLLSPERDPQSGYRLFDEAQVLRVQVVALLRRAGYDFEAIRPVLDAMAAGRPEQAVTAAEQRLQDLAAASRRCAAATAAFHAYVEEAEEIKAREAQESLHPD